MTNAKSTINHTKDYWHIVGILVGIGLLVFLGSAADTTPLGPPSVETTATTTEHHTPSSTKLMTGSAVNTATPVQLRIPRLNIDSDFHAPLSIQENGEVEVPETFNQVGWYQHSPVPGDLGPSVILGHVDSYKGPAVFYRIGSLLPGDQIFVTLDDGSEVEFVVERSEQYDQTVFPTELVYGDIDHAGLRLVTCSGWYDKATERYSHNRIVFARLVTP